jgi:hypothetical protein
MAQVKNTFLKSKMNKDLDSRILPNGEYRDAQNVSVSKSEGDDVGSLENVLSNELISNLKSLIIDIEVEKSAALSSTTPATSDQISAALNTLEVVGKFMDVKNNRIFLMLTNYTDTSPDRLSNFASADRYDIISVFPPPIVIGDFIYKGACCYIAMHDLSGDESSVLVGGNFLNFSKTHKIEGINILEDLLFFTDNRNQPRKINVRRAINEPFSDTTPYYTNEDHISVAKFAPVLPISLIEETSTDVWESTMKSKGEEYLPIHLIDTVDGLIGSGGTQIVLNRSVTWGDKTKMVCIGDKFTIPDPPGNDLEFTVTGYASGASPGTTFNFAPTPGDINPGETIPDGAIVKFQRPNPDYEPNYKGDEKVLKDKFQRFSYRFKYDDNEYSLFAPFTQETFIPQQFGYFINDNDQKSGESGVVSFMENLVDNIKFNIRLPYDGDKMSGQLKVQEIQIVSKASDELAIKVIEDVPIADLSSLSSQDYIYEYNSIKPYKTLPSDEITRVHDKVPVRAKCQEVTGSRVMYGNFVDKHTSPDFLNYQLKTTTKNNLDFSANTFNQIKKEYPNHTLKQNRTYTVGVVLIDRYGRSSNVVLSKQNVTISTDKVSTIYSNYSNFGTDTVANWPGELLEIQFNDFIPSSGANGYPGLYNASNNPLGWYSYKIVIKQQEQEYYNVYLPGILAGEIKWSGEFQPSYDNGSNKSTISLYGDNINKIPRDLNEVGPTDKQYRSSTVLYNRVNPNGWDSGYSKPYSTQSSVGKKPDTVDLIQPFKELGDWANSKGNLYPSEKNVVFDALNPPTPAPWYPFVGYRLYDPSVGTGNPRVFTDPLFRANENPFIAVLSTQVQTGVTPERYVSATPNEFGTEGPNRLGDTSLGVYETEPTSTELELFWETSTAGLITSDTYISGTNQYAGLNNLIEVGAPNGPFSFSNINFTLNEEDPSGTDATNYFECLDSGENPCADNLNVLTLVNVKDGFNNNRTKQFSLQQDGANPTRFKVVSNGEFIFNHDASVRENYTFFIEATANGQTNILSFTGSLSNTAPINVSFPNIARLNPASEFPTGAIPLTGVGASKELVLSGEILNGSNSSTLNTSELLYTIDFNAVGVDYSSNFNYYTDPSGKLVLTYTGGITYSGSYSLLTFKLRIKDANGNGDSYIDGSGNFFINFTVKITN